MSQAKRKGVDNKQSVEAPMALIRDRCDEAFKVHLTLQVGWCVWPLLTRSQ